MGKGGNSNLRETPVFRALYRPQMLLGGEREPMLLVALLSGGLAITGANVVSAVVGVILWLGMSTCLRLIAKVDPKMTKIFSRQLRYQKYYPAHSRPWRSAQSKRPY